MQGASCVSLQLLEISFPFTRASSLGLEAGTRRAGPQQPNAIQLRTMHAGAIHAYVSKHNIIMSTIQSHQANRVVVPSGGEDGEMMWVY